MVALPSPPSLPLLGHAHLFVTDSMIERFGELASRSSEGLFSLRTPRGTELAVVYRASLAEELLDETRYGKLVGGPLANVRAFTGDGLFTAHGDEPNWAKAHRILVPGFTMPSMKTYYPAMLEVAQQLVSHWRSAASRGGLTSVVEDTTRLTLDTIALTGFGFRFGSFDRPELHPFIAAMGRALTESGAMLRRTALAARFATKQKRQFAEDIATMHELVDRVIRERRLQGGSGHRDFLSLMLDAKDKVTGEPLDDVNIRYQVITFLIAGHETTSGLLAFALHLLLQNRAALAKARAEVDRVFGGTENPTFAQVGELSYVQAVLMETLRLWPTAPAITVTPHEPERLAGRWSLTPGQVVILLLTKLHRDPEMFDAPEDFRPERFEGDAAKKVPTHAYRPFGNGKRACIGKQFALVEAKLALALILAHFELEPEPGYTLRVKDTLTIKPEGFRVKLSRRRAP